MFNSLRLSVLSFLYYFGFTYAAFTALKQRSTSAEAVSAIEPTASASGPASPQPRSTKVVIGIPALKLMIMLTSMALLSYVGAECFPLFAEMRVIFMYTLLFSPPFTQQELYDQLFAPLLVRGGAVALSLQTSNFLSRKVPLFVVRRCVDVGIAAMNYSQRHHAVDEDAVRDILSGLVFSRRALQQVADLSREADGATYAQIARDSNFAVGVFTSRVKRALLNEIDEEDDGGEEGDEVGSERNHGFNARAPLGRVVGERTNNGWASRDVLSATTASTSSDAFSSGGRGRTDELVESIHSEHTSTDGELFIAKRTRRDKRKKHKSFFGFFS